MKTVVFATGAHEFSWHKILFSNKYWSQSVFFSDIKFILTRICIHKHQIILGLLQIMWIPSVFLSRKLAVYLETIFRKLLWPKSCYRSSFYQIICKIGALKNFAKLTEILLLKWLRSCKHFLFHTKFVLMFIIELVTTWFSFWVNELT